VSYFAPPLAVDRAGIDKINRETKESLGYSIFGYWYFYDEDDAGQILDDHVSPSHQSVESQQQKSLT